MTASARTLRSGMLGAALAAGLTAAAAGAGAASAQDGRPHSLTLYDQPDYRGASVTFYGDHASIGSTGFADRARSAQVLGSWRLCEGGGYRNHCETFSANVRDLSAYGLAGRVGSAQLLGVYAPPPTAPDAPSPYSPRPFGAGPYTDHPAPPPARTMGGRADAGPLPPPPYGRDDRYEPRPEPPREAAREAPIAGAARDYAPPPVDLPPAPDRYERPTYPEPAYAAPAADAGQVDGRNAVFFPRPLMRGADVAAAGQRSADEFCRTMGLGPALYFDEVGTMGRGGAVLRDLLCRR